MIAILIPTRGLIFTEVEQQVESIRIHLQNNCIVLRTHNLSIPESHNTLVNAALLIPEVTDILFIEEDVICDDRTALLKLLNSNEPIAFIDYSVNGYSCSAKSRNNQKILWCGLGFTKIKRKVFEKVEKPWFRTDKTFRLNSKEWIDQPYKYGGLDIWFFMHAREAGFEITQIPGECRHMQIKSLGKSEINKGLHELIDRQKITKQQFYDL